MTNTFFPRLYLVILLSLIAWMIPNAANAQEKIQFEPPKASSIPSGKFGDMVRAGRDIFVHTDKLRGKYVGNGLKCVNCHLDDGRHANSAPLWAAYTVYPAYRKKTGEVSTFEQRLQGCFKYSMNGKAPPLGSPELTALTVYSFWLATGAPVGESLPGRGYPKLAKPAESPSFARGAEVFATHCALCHGDNGEGTKAEGAYVFPPLWGKDSYNWGAGMHRIDTAAGFIKANMPLSKPDSLSDQQAWDVATFVNSHERPQDPRFRGSVAATKKALHEEDCRYGDKVNGHVLGSPKK